MRSRHSVKEVLASLFILIGFLTVTARAQVPDKKGLTAGGGKPAVAAADVIVLRGNSAISLGADTPAASSSPQITYVESQKVASLFAEGGVMLDWNSTDINYRVLISRVKGREHAESHHFTHVFYILEGSATFVTGGTIVDPKIVNDGRHPAGDIVGPSIEGGETRLLSKGDVIIVPGGIPHQWTEVKQSPFYKFVVQVR